VRQMCCQRLSSTRQATTWCVAAGLVGGWAGTFFVFVLFGSVLACVHCVAGFARPPGPRAWDSLSSAQQDGQCSMCGSVVDGAPCSGPLGFRWLSDYPACCFVCLAVVCVGGPHCQATGDKGGRIVVFERAGTAKVRCMHPVHLARTAVARYLWLAVGGGAGVVVPLALAPVATGGGLRDGPPCLVSLLTVNSPRR
jgi:hypothetical protein